MMSFLFCCYKICYPLSTLESVLIDEKAVKYLILKMSVFEKAQIIPSLFMSNNFRFLRDFPSWSIFFNYSPAGLTLK